MDRVTSISKAEDKAVETFNQYKSKPEFIVRSVMQGANCGLVRSPIAVF